MKIILCFLVLLTGAVHSYPGHGVSGAVTLSGFLKSAAMRGSIPLGSISSTYGYEAINFPSSTPTYCYGGVALSTNTSLLGLSFGGSGAGIMTVGQCHRPSDYTGGFLTLAMNYEMSQGQKSASVQASFGLGFDLAVFNKTLIDNFSTDERGVKKRTRAAIWHFIKYAGRANAKKLGKHYVWLKLLSLPLMTALGNEWRSGLAELKFTTEEMKSLEKRNKMFALKDDIHDLFYKAKMDVDFYKCTGKDCEKIYVDAYYLMQAIESAMADCHSVSLVLNVASSYDVKIPFIANKLNFSFGYNYYGIKEEKSVGKDTKLQAISAYANHRFSTKSDSCKKIEETAAWSFGEFLAIMGVGGK